MKECFVALRNGSVKLARLKHTALGAGRTTGGPHRDQTHSASSSMPSPRFVPLLPGAPAPTGESISRDVRCGVALVCLGDRRIIDEAELLRAGGATARRRSTDVPCTVDNDRLQVNEQPTHFGRTIHDQTATRGLL